MADVRALGLERFTTPPRGSFLEQCWRRLRFRSHQPNPWEELILQRKGARATPAGGRAFRPSRLAKRCPPGKETCLPFQLPCLAIHFHRTGTE